MNRTEEYLNEDVITGISNNQFAQSIAKVISDYENSVKHGHFEISVKGQIGKGKRREVIVKTAREYKFNIPADELP